MNDIEALLRKGENLKFDITVTPRLLHFKNPAGTSRGVYTTRKSWFVELRNSGFPGRVGVGECAPLPDLSCDFTADYEDRLRGFCKKFSESGKIDYELMRNNPSMLFGFETAVADFCVGNPTFFDTPFSRGEEGIPINGLVWMGTHDEMLCRLEKKIDDGFHCIKLKIGAIDFEQELDLVKRIRAKFSNETMELRLDANGGFSTNEALGKLERLSKYSIHSVEQPIKQGQWDEMRRICASSPIPIALDEELIGLNDQDTMCNMLDELKPSYIILKPSLHGGMLGVSRWISEASKRGVGSWITSALESNVGLNAIAQLAAAVYGPYISMPQGLGTGLLFTDNVPMPIEIRGSKLWFRKEKI